MSLCPRATRLHRPDSRNAEPVAVDLRCRSSPARSGVSKQTRAIHRSLKRNIAHEVYNALPIQGIAWQYDLWVNVPEVGVEYWSRLSSF